MSAALSFWRYSLEESPCHQHSKTTQSGRLRLIRSSQTGYMVQLSKVTVNKDCKFMNLMTKVQCFSVQLTAALTTVRHVNKTDTVTLGTTFGVSIPTRFRDSVRRTTASRLHLLPCATHVLPQSQSRSLVSCILFATVSRVLANDVVGGFLSVHSDSRSWFRRFSSSNIARTDRLLRRLSLR